MDALRLRLEEKEATLNKKSKQIQEMSEEKGTLNGEIHDLKDMLEVKERKVNVLQKKVFNQVFFFFNHLALSKITMKMHSSHAVHVLWLVFILHPFALQIENLQEQLRDKEKQMSSLKERVKSLQADTSNTDTALTTLEESLSEKVSLSACIFIVCCLNL